MIYTGIQNRDFFSFFRKLIMSLLYYYSQAVSTIVPTKKPVQCRQRKLKPICCLSAELIDVKVNK